VVGGFIQHKEVGAFQREDRQRQPAALTAGECNQRLEDILAAEEVCRQVMARLPGIHLLVAQQFIQHTAVACQTIVRLGKIANLQAGSKLHLAGERIELTQESLQETGLAAAVGTDKGNKLTLLNGKGRDVEDRRPPQLNLQIFNGNNAVFHDHRGLSRCWINVKR